MSGHRTDLRFMPDTYAAEVENLPLTSHAILWCTTAFIIIAITWANIAKLDEISRANGRVIPSSQIQIVQNLEGGILTKVLVKAGDNLGWKRTEANTCFEKSGPCQLKDYAPAFVQYGHDVGQSITGGYVYRGKALKALIGRYVFADFVSGRLWSAALPSKAKPLSQLVEIGQYTRLISSFGQAADGTLYVLDFAKGEVLSLDGALRR